MIRTLISAGAAAFLFSSCATAPGGADSAKTVSLNAVNAQGIQASVGTVTIVSVTGGVEFRPSLKGLPPGEHGFHVHENPSCAAGLKDGKPGAALAAGAHYDPDQAGVHGPPEGPGHRGDLPALQVDENGNATQRVHSSRLTLAELSNRSLMVHAGGDNHSDHPEPLGGGGARIFCGVIP